MCPKEPCMPQGSSSSSESSSQELPGEYSCLWLAETIPSLSSCQQMPFPGSPAKHHPKSRGSVTLPALQRLSVPTAVGRSHPVPVRAESWAHPLMNPGAGVVGGCAEDAVFISLPSRRVHGLQQETWILLR